MHSYYTKQRAISLLFFTLLSIVGFAQCENLGVIKAPSEDCPLCIFNLSTEQYFEFDNSEFDLMSGQAISYSYVTNGNINNCDEVTLIGININCLDISPTTEGLETICEITNCVYPGDTDEDIKANVSDLLNIGLAYGTSGPERPLATNVWGNQVAPDWEETTVEDVNYKHIDCNGDGYIDENDANVIFTNYLPEQELFSPTNEEGAPSLSINFSTDSIFFENNSPQQATVTATVSLGNANIPVENLHGLTFMLQYPQDLVPPHSVNSIYNEESFLGNEEETLTLTNDISPLGRNDIAVTRKSGDAIDGEGIIFTTSFIVIIDIIAGRAEAEIPFKVAIKNIEAVDGDGNPIIINGPTEDAEFIIIDNTTTDVLNLELANKIELSPNPSIDVLNINLNDVQVEKLEIFDTFGRKILVRNNVKETASFDVSAYNSGLYFVHIQTLNGLVTKKFLIEK